MAKIFSNINKVASGSVHRYNSSTVNSNFTTFTNLRANVNSSLQASTVLVTNRVKKVYETYTDPVTTSTPLVRTYQESDLITPAIVTRIRPSPFYNGFRIANSSLNITNPAENFTLIEIKPYSSDDPISPYQGYSVETSKMITDSQSLPLISGPRDVKRINRYLATDRGKEFKLLQSVLQSGATFGQARTYNPISIETMVGNYSVATLYNPLTRVSRLVEGTAITDKTLQGRLQKETAISNQSRLKIKFVGGRQSPRSGIAGAAQNALDSYIQNKINSISFSIGGRKINVGQVGRTLDQLGSQLEAGVAALNINSSTLIKDQTAYDALYLNNLWPLMKENDGTINNFQNTRQSYIQRARAALSKEKGSSINQFNTFINPYPEINKDYRSSATYTDDVRGTPFLKNRNVGIVTTYLQDKFNIQGTDERVTDIKTLQRDDKDYVMFKIVVPTVYDAGIRFRAFIEDFTHNAKGEYEDIRYVGRPERFITYRGMNRSITLSMYLVAFGQPELDAVWLRADMLNKLVYPIDAANGFMVPPLARLTVGNVIQDQYGYVENIDMRLTDIPWDIDRELPQAIKVNMTFNIIENAFTTQKSTTKLFANEITSALGPRNGTNGAAAAAEGNGEPAQADAVRASDAAGTATLSGTQLSAKLGEIGKSLGITDPLQRREVSINYVPPVTGAGPRYNNANAVPTYVPSKPVFTYVSPFTTQPAPTQPVP